MNIVNWECVFNESNNFKNRSPTKWAFIEEFLDKDFYEENNWKINKTLFQLK